MMRSTLPKFSAPGLDPDSELAHPRARCLCPAAVVILVSALIVACGCRAVDVLVADCDAAQVYMTASMQLRIKADIPLAFKTVGEPRPLEGTSVLDAKIILARKSVACRCSWRPAPAFFLGSLLVQKGECVEAVKVLQESIDAEPMADAYRSLADAYDCLGRTADADDARAKAKKLKGAWD